MKANDRDVRCVMTESELVDWARLTLHYSSAGLVDCLEVVAFSWLAGRLATLARWFVVAWLRVFVVLVMMVMMPLLCCD